MNATELRIGNYYDHNGEVRQVTPNTILEVWESERTWCKPIPITEEWLVKFGFKYKKAGRYAGADMWAGMGFISNGIVNFRGTPNHLTLEGYFNTQIKYIHQLQNLYFALTGKELEFKKQ